MRDEEKYKKQKQEIRKLCRQDKDKYYEDKCKEIEMLDQAHSQLMYQKIKELRSKGNRGLYVCMYIALVSAPYVVDAKPKFSCQIRGAEIRGVGQYLEFIACCYYELTLSGGHR